MSMSLPTKDHDLLARLNALKPSTISLEGQTSVSETQGDDIAARFLQFRTRGEGAAPKPEPEHSDAGDIFSDGGDDKTLEELLAEIGPEDQWTLNPDDPKDIARLMNEAKGALKDVEPERNTKHTNEDEDSNPAPSKQTASAPEENTRRVNDIKVDDIELQTDTPGQAADKSNKAEDDVPDTEADAALQRILDELSLETALIDKDLISTNTNLSANATPQKMNRTEMEQESVLDLPSTPETIPVARNPTGQEKSSGFDLPSVPANKPSKKVAKSNLPTYTNEEIDTWCVICNDDATVRCHGCDEDLYCAKCWKEGHTGPDAGYEEKMHKWSRYSKPR